MTQEVNMRMRSGVWFTLSLFLAFGQTLIAGAGPVGNPAVPGDSPIPGSLSISLEWSADQIRVTPAGDGTTVVQMEGGFSRANPGSPDLPWVVVEVPVERGLMVESWNWVEGPSQRLADGVTPSPAWQDRPSTDGGPVAVEPDPFIYQGAIPYPVENVIHTGMQGSSGTVRAYFLVCPFRWDPTDGSLTWIPSGELRINLVPDSDPERFLPPSLRPRASADGIDGTGKTRGSGAQALYRIDERLRPMARPSLDSPPVEYVIVTDTLFVESFRPLADYKTETGHPAAIRTVQWIEDHYPHGVDLSEKIRFFLRDAYLYWGTQAVLLGGDPKYVPIRYGRTYAYNPSRGGVDVATDYYYACLDGSWNSDGDDRWGEGFYSDFSPISDNADLIPELRVGRISARDVTQVQTYVRKYMDYVKTPDLSPDYITRILGLAEVLFDSGWTVGMPEECNAFPRPPICMSSDGANDLFTLEDTIRASPQGDVFSFVELLERHYWWNEHRTPPAGQLPAEPLNISNTLRYLNQGANIVYHMGHGDRDRWAIGPDRFLTSNAEGLTNGTLHRYSGLAYVVNCNSAAVDADCVGEAWLGSPQGGGVVYIGSTNLDFPQTARVLQSRFFHDWLADPWMTPGQATFESQKVVGAQVANMDNTFRFLLFSLIFLGDPDLYVWREIPGAMTANYDPAAVQVGGASIPVTVTRQGVPLEKARVSFYKDGDALASALTDAEGRATIQFAPTSTGEYRLSVTHPKGLPLQQDETVRVPVQSRTVVADYTLTDDGTGGSAGNGNGQFEMGERVLINLHLANRGSASAQSMEATLELDPADSVSFMVTLLDSTETLPSLPPGEELTASGAFLVSARELLPPIMPGKFRLNLPLHVRLQATDGSHVQDLRPVIYRPDLLIMSNVVREIVAVGTPDSMPDNGETLSLAFQLYNKGEGTWNHLRGRIVPLSAPAVTIEKDTVYFDELAPRTTAFSDSFVFQVHQTANMRLRFTLEDTLGGVRTIWSKLIWLPDKPDVPLSLTTAGTPNAIRLIWQPRSANYGTIAGYRVYRSPAIEGPWELLPPGLVAGMNIYSDEGLPTMTRFFYKVAAVDISGNEGEATEPSMGSTAPGFAPGWPNYILEAKDVSPVVFNLNEWGPNELFVPSATMYAFGGDGSDYHDGDNSPSTRGVLTLGTDAQNFQAKPAIFDLLPEVGDGHAEIIGLATNGQNGSWDPPASLCVFDWRGNLLWKRTLVKRAALSSPVIANLDGDDQMEIAFLCGKWVWAFNHDGTPLGPDPEGKLLQIPGAAEGQVDWQYPSIAVADVDDDPRQEMIFTTYTLDGAFAKLYVINGEEPTTGAPLYGTNVEGFPFTYSTEPGAGTREGSNASAAVGDVTSRQANLQPGEPDGKPDIVISTHSRLWVFDPHARTAEKLVWSKPLQPRPDLREDGPLTSSPALGDIDGDGKLDIAVGAGTGYLYVLNGKGQPLNGFAENASEPFRRVGTQYARMGSPILADLSGDGKPEVIIGDSEGRVHALQHDGSFMAGFPYVIPGGKIGTGILAWDVDRDGNQNLIILADKIQQVFVLDLALCPFDPSVEASPWPQFRHDPLNTGNLLTEIPTPTRLAAPSATAAGDLTVDLRWENEEAWTAFRIDRKEDPDGEWIALAEYPAAQIQEEPGRFHAVDQVPAPGTWRYRIAAIGVTGGERLSEEVLLEVSSSPGLAFKLYAPVPNPFHPETQIRLDLPREGSLELQVLDVSGRIVRKLHRGRAAAGSLVLHWDGKDDGGRPVGSGIYFVQVRAEGQGEASHRLVFLK